MKLSEFWKSDEIYAVIALISIPLAAILAVSALLSDNWFIQGIFGIGFLLLVALTIGSVRISSRATEGKAVLEAEQRYLNTPVPQPAWDLARIKLEDYLDRNLKQVKHIFWLTVVVMFAGCVLIFYGVTDVLEDPTKLNPAIVASSSGVIVNIIGATFLVIYRAIMAQARDHLLVLERINAVGMAVQIISGIGGPDNPRTRATEELARQILAMYAVTSTYTTSSDSKPVSS